MLEFFITQRRKSISRNVEALRCCLSNFGPRNAARARAYYFGNRQLSTANDNFFPALHLLE